MTDFEKLANSESMDDKIKAASDPKCPAKIIDQIIMNEELSWSGPKGEELMGATAANPNTESHHLSNCWNATQIESHRLSILKISYFLKILINWFHCVNILCFTFAKQ